jgi:hypothetical protein
MSDTVSLYHNSFFRWDYILVPVLRDGLSGGQCHLNSPISFLSWLMLIFNGSLIFCQIVPEKIPITYCCPGIDFQDFWWSLFIQTIMTCLASLSKLPHAVSCPVNGCPNPSHENGQQSYSLQFFCILPVTLEINDNPRPV